MEPNVIKGKTYRAICSFVVWLFGWLVGWIFGLSTVAGSFKSKVNLFWKQVYGLKLLIEIMIITNIIGYYLLPNSIAQKLSISNIPEISTPNIFMQFHFT